MAFKWSLVVGLVWFLSITLAQKEVLGNKHNEQEDNENWWRHEVFYQIYPRSFQDSNNDGIGDLNGITSRLQYFADTGITAIWLSPIFKSPMADFGYDISDYRDIHGEYGSLMDFDALIDKANRLGIKVILDFVPNHSSDEHEWFKRSAAKEPGYDDFYVWKDSAGEDDQGNQIPPNNWVSVFNGPAWHWHEGRKQFYLHQFTVKQPDLNYRNPAVVKAMDEVLLYWLQRGVAGFRIDAVNYVYEDEDFRNEPLSGVSDDTNSVDYLTHIYTRNLQENYGLIQHWRELLDNYAANHPGPARIMMTEGYADFKQVIEFYEDANGAQGAHFPFNFDFITELNAASSAQDFVYYIQRWLIYMPPGHSANWVLGNHDNPRVASRYGVKTVDAMNMIVMTLPGIGITYYGEELGMEDYRDITFADTVDRPACEAGENNYKSISRDPERTPMQWTDEQNAGFSTAVKTWLPVHPNYPELNLRAQQEATRSHYKVYKALLKLRQSRVLQEGSFAAQAYNRHVFAFKRELKGQNTLLTIINTSNRNQQVDVSDFIDMPNQLTILVISIHSQHRVGERLKNTEVKLSPYEGLVIQLKPRK